MKNTAPILEGIIAVAAIFGLIGGTVSYVAWDYSFIGAVFMAAVIATIVGIILFLGWRPSNTNSRDMAAEAHRAGQAPTVPATGVKAPKPVPAPAPVAPAAKPAAAVAAAPAAVPAEPKPAPAAPKAEPAAAAKPAATADKDYDGDGIVEGTGEGTKPATLTAARDGGPDDLKQIKGVGPKMESMLHGMGFYHFDQIAAWSGDEVAWVDSNLEGFKGRVSRDSWVDQAKTLAAGGETEFSKKVEKGGVY